MLRSAYVKIGPKMIAKEELSSSLFLCPILTQWIYITTRRW
jgi:hypothetical protein